MSLKLKFNTINKNFREFKTFFPFYPFIFKYSPKNSAIIHIYFVSAWQVSYKSNFKQEGLSGDPVWMKLVKRQLVAGSMWT